MRFEQSYLFADFLSLANEYSVNMLLDGLREYWGIASDVE
jgi:hypothetical protein